MLEISTLAENPIENPAAGEVSDGLKAEHGEDVDRNFAANRWPREETMALLKIRSEMDVAFRDTSPKAPLWEQVSRKLAELGYNRSAKKCKEKFENTYKYHRRTKEGRCGKKTNGSKTYRFFEQLEALDGHHSPPQPIPNSSEEQNNNNNNVSVIKDAVPCSISFPSANALELSSSTTSSSGDNKKKKKVTQFFEGLMREVIEKQETLQRKFMEVLEKCEQDRIAREEAWKREELARIKRERELLAQERSIATAKDEAVLAFLKKFTQENTLQIHLPDTIQNNKDMQENNNANEKEEECGNNVTSVGVGVEKFIHMSSSRWPKDEVEALIRLRTQLDVGNNNNNNNNKGPLWEEISLAMKNLGYDRSAKRCKEKWENINKYFKRMKEKNKRKPLDSKTCPYYHHLEALYSKKPKKVDELGGGNNNSGNYELKPEELLMHIMESGEERQQQEEQQNMDQSSSEDAERENMDQNQGDNEDQDGYQMVANANSPSSIAIMS